MYHKDSPSCLSPSPCSLGYRTSSLGGSLGRGGVEAHREPGEPGGLALECRRTTENHPPPQRYLHHAHPLLALCNSIKKQRNKLALLSILSGWGSRGRLGGSHISMQSASSCDGGEPVGAVGGGCWSGQAGPAPTSRRPPQLSAQKHLLLLQLHSPNGAAAWHLLSAPLPHALASPSQPQPAPEDTQG